MTINASATQFGLGLPDQGDREAAGRLREIIAQAKQGDAYALHVPNRGSAGSSELVLSPRMAELLLNVLRHVSSGRTVTLVPTGETLTTQQAADILNVSRPYLVKLLESGAIAFDKVNRHRRIKARDLFAYKETRDAQRSAALDRLAEIDGGLI